jgi:prolyl oligopeptidase PreP (S9A serine peptidase family)
MGELRHGAAMSDGCKTVVKQMTAVARDQIQAHIKTPSVLAADEGGVAQAPLTVHQMAMFG